MSTASQYRVNLTNPRRLDPVLAQQIDALAAVSIDPNPFYESWMLDPALEHLRTPALQLVTVHHRSEGLTGVFPFELARYRNLPMRSLRSWRHDYLFLCSPLIAEGHAVATLTALFDWSASRQSPARVIELNAVRGDGPFAAALAEALAARPSFAVYSTSLQRALLDLRIDPEAGVSHKHLKELRRQERRLADLGALRYRALARDEAPDAWIERFLTLEARGWKGEEGSALASEAGSRAYFAEIARQAARRGRLQMLELTLDGVPLAAKCNFVDRDGAFAFKIAHDETHAKYSPGVLLEQFNMRYLKEECPQVGWMDSCAKAQHFMINRLWTQRRTIASHSICGRGLAARTLIRHGTRIARLRAKARTLSGRETNMQAPAVPGSIDPSSGTRFLKVDPAEVMARFDREPFLVSHSLCDHPLLQLPRLIDLARTLPEDSVEYNAGNLNIDQPPDLTPRNGLSIEETLRQIETCGSWMVLKNIQQDPTYRALLDSCLDQMQPLIETVAPGMARRRAFIFVSSPGATTPYHVDYEHNFLLHVRGEKMMSVWNGEDRSVMSELERERMVTGGHRNLPYREEFAAKGRTFDLRPGMGLHVPLSSPHTVKVGEHVSISLSITFLTRPGERVRALHTTNAFLRRRGVSPSEVGASRPRDSLKFLVYRTTALGARAWSRIRNALRGRTA